MTIRATHRHNYWRILRYAVRQWPRLGVILALTLVSSASTVLQPWPLKIIVDYAFGDTDLPAWLQSEAAGMGIELTAVALIVAAAAASFALFLIGSALENGLAFSWASAGHRMMYDLAADVFQKLQRLSLIYHSHTTVGDSLNRISGDTWSVYKLTNAVLIAPAQHILTLLAIGGVAWALDPKLALVSLLGVPIMATGSFFFGRWLKANTHLQRDFRSRRIAFIQQTLSAIPIVKAFGSENRNNEIFLTFAGEASWLAKRKALLEQGARTINGSTSAIIIAMVLLVGGQRVLSGAVTLGSLLVFLAYVRSINKSVRGLIQTYVTLKQVEVGVERLVEVLDSDETIEDPPDGRALPLLSDKSRGHVRFENVTFGYVPNFPILRDVNLDVQPGESVAIIGKTGSGKTTLVSLIPRFFDPWSGRVTLDGYDLRDIRLSGLRANVALVLQEPFLLPMSIADNIAYGRPDASQAEIIGAAVAANADGFIRKLPDGYETLVAERGVTLSGGQKQLLAIARALLMDASVLILDEPTSALDAETEAQVMEAIHRLVEGRTTFIIAHRLSTIRKAERIIVIEDGSIVEAGTHQELLAKGGRYHHLQQAQMRESSERLRA